MDNASKALIMAGAILIAVALVGVGVYLYSSATGMMNSGVDELMSADMLTKNAKIEQYEGQITGSELKTLLRSLRAYNNQEIFPTELNAGIEIGDVRNSANYNVTLDYDDQGWIDTIEVELLSGAAGE